MAFRQLNKRQYPSKIGIAKYSTDKLKRLKNGFSRSASFYFTTDDKTLELDVTNIFCSI